MEKRRCELLPQGRHSHGHEPIIVRELLLSLRHANPDLASILTRDAARICGTTISSSSLSYPLTRPCIFAPQACESGPCSYFDAQRGPNLWDYYFEQPGAWRPGDRFVRLPRRATMGGAAFGGRILVRSVQVRKNVREYKPVPAPKKETWKRSLFSMAIASRPRAPDAG
jgi:hypothetical protein